MSIHKFIGVKGKNGIPSRIETVEGPPERFWHKISEFHQEFDIFRVYRLMEDGTWRYDWLVEGDNQTYRPDWEGPESQIVQEPVDIMDIFDRLSNLHPTRTTNFMDIFNGLSLSREDAAKPKLELIKGE